MDFDVKEGGGVEGNVGVDVLLVVVAGAQAERGGRGGDFRELEDVLVGLDVLGEGEVLA